ncbi:hypothetical protein JCM3765_006702 [Sporobolomyces pararoseus]
MKPLVLHPSTIRSASSDVVESSQNPYFVLIIIILRQIKQINVWNKACDRANLKKQQVFLGLEEGDRKHVLLLSEIVELRGLVVRDNLKRAELNRSLHYAQVEVELAEDPLVEALARLRSGNNLVAIPCCFCESKEDQETIAELIHLENQTIISKLEYRYLEAYLKHSLAERDLKAIDERAQSLQGLESYWETVDENLKSRYTSLGELTGERIQAIDVELEPTFKKCKRAERLMNFAAFDLVLEWNLQRRSLRKYIRLPRRASPPKPEDLEKVPQIPQKSIIRSTAFWILLLVSFHVVLMTWFS